MHVFAGKSYRPTSSDYYYVYEIVGAQTSCILPRCAGRLQLFELPQATAAA
jgi:hypothetical protein